jgi:hypothetical protein
LPRGKIPPVQHRGQYGLIRTHLAGGNDDMLGQGTYVEERPTREHLVESNEVRRLVASVWHRGIESAVHMAR